MDDAAVAAGIRRVITFVRGVTLDFPDLPPERQPSWVSQVVNQFANPGTGAEDNVAIGYAAKDNTYRQTAYQIEEDEALIIRGQLPRCRFANVMLWNKHMQTMPYRGRQVSLNRTQIQFDEEGRFRLVVAHKDPKSPNWLDAAGSRTGTIFWRIQLAEGTVPPLSTELVPLRKAATA